MPDPGPGPDLAATPAPTADAAAGTPAEAAVNAPATTPAATAAPRKAGGSSATAKAPPPRDAAAEDEALHTRALRGAAREAGRQHAATEPAPRPKKFPTPTPDEVREAFETGRYPYGRRMARAAYEEEKARLQAELLKVQLWAQETGQKFVILFEGRDAAGKGGTIKRFNEHLNPRFARVVALQKPTEQERGQWYFQRYVRHLPT